MVFHQTEAKFQTWRALAVFEDGSECLLYVGRSTVQIRAGYADACREVLDEEELSRVRQIKLQCWQGAADKGRWVPMGTLAVPTHKAAMQPEAVTETEPMLLPFRRPLEEALKAHAT